MNKEKAIKIWKNALSNFQQDNLYKMSNLDSIQFFEVESDIISIKVGVNVFECSFSSLAKSTGRTASYLETELRTLPEEDFKQFLEQSFQNQSNIKLFFSELTDAVISMNRICLIDEESISWVEELESQYIDIWQVAPSFQNAPFPTEQDEFPNLNSYGLSFMASGE